MGTRDRKMGNKLARNRLKAQDFHYIAKNTAFLTNDVVSDYYNEIIEKFGNTGQMDPDTFKRLFLLAFPERPADNLGQMFNLFDEDGNGNISIEELLNMMAFFIEIGMDTGNVDMAATMAEVFQKGDRNKDDKLTKQEFVIGMSGHPVTAKILQVKTIDGLLSTF